MATLLLKKSISKRMKTTKTGRWSESENIPRKGLKKFLPRGVATQRKDIRPSLINFVYLCIYFYTFFIILFFVLLFLLVERALYSESRTLRVLVVDVVLLRLWLTLRCRLTSPHYTMTTTLLHLALDKSWTCSQAMWPNCLKIAWLALFTYSLSRFIHFVHLAIFLGGSWLWFYEFILTHSILMTFFVYDTDAIMMYFSFRLLFYVIYFTVWLIICPHYVPDYYVPAVGCRLIFNIPKVFMGDNLGYIAHYYLISWV